MIDAALAHIAGQLNLALRRAQGGVQEDMVVLANPVDLQGRVADNVSNKLMLFLVNIERETLAYRDSSRGAGPGRDVVGSTPAHLNLSVMCAAHFEGANYAESLKRIANAIAFFQGRPVFNHQNTPDLDPRINKLTLEIENLDTASLSHLWGVLGGRYLPSVLYKVRMVTVDPGDVRAQPTRVAQPEVGVGA